MTEIQMGVVEARFADIIWSSEPVAAAELARKAQEALGWKKTTAYTVLKRLCEKGIFQNQKGLVTSLLSRQSFYSMRSKQFVQDTFDGSLPAFIAAFTQGRALTAQEREQLRQMIDQTEEV